MRCYKGITAIFLMCCVSAFAESWDIASMTLDQKIGQLFMADAYANQEEADSENLGHPCLEIVEHWISDYQIGGILLKRRWEPQHQHELVTHYQELSQIPLFIAQDIEPGMTTHLQLPNYFPNAKALGTMADNSVYLIGKALGKICHMVGVNFNFAPVVDVHTNPDNPIINDRSFGSNPDNVARKGIALMKGLQEYGILACAKHFPGHGDTSVDSHHVLPVVDHPLERLHEVELYPFRRLIASGVKSVMCGHLLVPALDDANPTSLSHEVVTDLLQEELGFVGLIVTDDLLMKGVSKDLPPGELALRAFLAGNDIILLSRDIDQGVARLKQAVLEGIVSELEIDRRVHKILKAKEWIVSYSD